MQHNTAAVPEKTSRMLSIDVFRGLTIFTMIFVNDLAGIRNIPGWMKHVPAEADAMTFVDVVFPAFLFIVGMAIPLAIRNRLNKGAHYFTIGKHIFIRTAALLVLGLLMVNISVLNPQATGMSKYLWALLMFISAIFVWNRYPQTENNRRYLFLALKIGGVLMLLFLAIIYRGGETGNVHWLKTQWWGILGLIGWSYLVCSSLYLIFKNHIAAHIGMLCFFVFLYIGDKSGALHFLPFIHNFLWLGGHIGGHASITTAGMIVTLLFLPDSTAQDHRKRINWILTFTLFLFISGYLLRPLYGISKIYATPSWSLYCSAICCLIFLFLHWLIDIKQIKNWANFLKPAGANPLLAYILPDIFYYLLALAGITLLGDYLGEGLLGIGRSLVFALLMLVVTNQLSRVGVKLQL